MEDIHCASCREEFDTKTRLPRLFPNCGHTFCSICIQEMIDESEDTLCCPEDNVECQFFNKTVGIGCFPLNFALHRLINQNTSKRGITTLDRLDAKPKIEEFPNLNYCNDHSKVSELVCLTDRRVICTDCVLFGLHKSHQYTRMDDFKKEVKMKLAALENKTESIKYKSFLSNSEKQVDVLKEKIDFKKRMLMNSVHDNINAMAEEIRSKEKEMEESLDSRFNKFEYAINVIDNTAKKLKEKQMSVERTMNKIKTQVKKRDFDYSFLMNSLYAENNVFETVKELVEELGQLENTSTDVIDKELDRYSVQGGINQVIKLVHECMDIVYYDPSAEDPMSDKKTKQNFDDDNEIKTHGVTPSKVRKSKTIVERRKTNKSRSNTPDEHFKSDININSKDDSLVFDKSNNDISKSGLNLNRDESVSLIDVHLDDMDSELLEAKNSNDESANDQSISNIQNTSLVSKNQGMKKNASFFKKNTVVKQPDTVNNSYYPNELKESKVGYSTSSQNNNLVFLPESYRRGELTQSLYQKTPHPDSIPQTRDRFTVSQMRDKQPSWNDQDNMLSNARTVKSPVRRPTLNNRFAPISSKQIAIESETEINLSRMNINDHAIPQIITEILKNKNLKALNLSHNSITEIGFEQLLKKLAMHPTLERIYMMNNYLDDSVFVKLEQWVKKLKKINYFNFQNCSHFKNIVKIKKYVAALSKLGLKIDI